MQESNANSSELYSALAEGPPNFAANQIQETAFEKRRGISRVETRPGYAQIYVDPLAEPLAASRLALLREVADEGVSIDFLKLTQSGLSFVVDQESAARVAQRIAKAGFAFEALEDRHIVLVHAENMRDEAGLIADVMKHAIGSGARIEHVTDMHNRMLMVVPADQSAILVQALQALGGGL